MIVIPARLTASASSCFSSSEKSAGFPSMVTSSQRTICSSPCSPTTGALMADAGLFSLSAKRATIRDVSRVQPVPKTLPFGICKNLAAWLANTSTGLDTTITMALVFVFLISEQMPSIILEFFINKSLRLSPTLRATPAVITITSLSLQSA